MQGTRNVNFKMVASYRERPGTARKTFSGGYHSLRSFRTEQFPAFFSTFFLLSLFNGSNIKNLCSIFFAGGVFL